MARLRGRRAVRSKSLNGSLIGQLNLVLPMINGCDSSTIDYAFDNVV